MNRKLALSALALLALCTFATQSRAFSLLGTGFTYQGRLNDGAAPANGTYDLVFTAYDGADPSGVAIAGPVTNAATVVSNGIFTVTVDFGSDTTNAFNFNERWLEIGARTNGAASFVTLTPRQRISITPYAFAALNAGQLLGNLPASKVQGTLSLAQLPSGILTNNQTDVSLSGSFAGNGAGLTNVNAKTIGGASPNGFWQIAGNAGTTPGANFIGTTDNQPLEIQVNAIRALRIEPHGTSAPSLAGGYFQNSVAGFYGAVVAGGGTSAAANGVSGNYAFIGAGYGGNAGNNGAVIGGAYNNAPGSYGFIGTGLANTNLSDYSFIGNGSSNLIQLNSTGSFIGTGTGIVIAHDSTDVIISGGIQNRVGTNSGVATIGGGALNIIQDDAGSSTISGGWGNQILNGAIYSTISGGLGNTAGGANSFVGGGGFNQDPSYGNSANGQDSAIVGGSQNIANSYFSFIGGGANNTVQSNAAAATIGAGNYNLILDSANFATIAGGGNNTNGGAYATIGGGAYNSTLGQYSAILGGFKNSTPGLFSVASGGRFNNSTGSDATVPGGYANLAAGNFSFAAGQQAQALHQGSFVWADSQNAVFASTVADQFNVRAKGGVRLSTAGAGMTLDGPFTTTGQIVLNSANGFAMSSLGNFYIDAPFNGGGRFTVLSSGNVGIGTNNPSQKLTVLGGALFTSGAGGAAQSVSWTPGSASWTFTSDRATKERFAPVDTQSVLERLARMPLSEWSYIGFDQRHIGPMAQDFHAQFPFNKDDKSLNDADLHGVALAAIQGLNEKVEAGGQRAENKIQKSEDRIEKLEVENAELKARLEKLERFMETKIADTR